MAGAPDELHELPPPTPAPPELIERATALVREYPECFWFWHPEASVKNLQDVRLVVEHLREYGGWRAWRAAQDLHRCLSPLRKRRKPFRALDPIALKTAWIEMSDEAEAKMASLADEQPDLPIGVAFVDAKGKPGWIGDDPSLRMHTPCLRGCWG